MEGAIIILPPSGSGVFGGHWAPCPLAWVNKPVHLLVKHQIRPVMKCCTW